MAGFGGESTVQRMRTQLPVTRVRKICKIDATSCSIISAEAVQLLTLATERFIGLLAKAAYGQAMFDKRKTLQLKDLEFCIKSYDVFNFLDGALDGWPETTKKSGAGSIGDQLSAAVLANISLGENDTTNAVDEGQKGAEEEEEEEQGIEDCDVDGLSDEIFGFDESLQGTIPVESPFDHEIPPDQQRDEETTATENSGNGDGGQDTEMDDTVVPETQVLKPTEIFGHYGYYRPTNSVANENGAPGTAGGMSETDAMVTDVQMDEEMQVTQALDTSTAFDFLSRTGIEVATDTAAAIPQTQPLSNQDIFQSSLDESFLSNS